MFIVLKIIIRFIDTNINFGILNDNALQVKQKILFIIPPFTQLNTPYPSTAYLKGFLNEHGIESVQYDLGIEVFGEIFSKSGLMRMFSEAEKITNKLSDNSQRIFDFSAEYIEKVEIVVSYLRNQNPGAVYLLSEPDFYPQASKFEQIHVSSQSFGTLGIRDLAVHYASLFLDDLADFISEAVDSMFGFSRYAEHLALSPPYFDDLDRQLKSADSFTQKVMLQRLEEILDNENPEIVAFSIPFPGNFYTGLKCAAFLKKYRPETKIIFGGGYVNTELRWITDVRIFDYLDYITLDDGETPLLFLLEYFSGRREQQFLKRTFLKSDNQVVYIDGAKEKDISVSETGTPDYSDFRRDKYLSFTEIANPMHRLWSDGFWNKLTLAHGCYWAKCSFCDTSLDYIKRYEPVSAKIICDRIDSLIEQNHNRSFHFTDEAAPPALLRELALELMRRRTRISWWTNIRFEKNFTLDLCRLLKESGCIAVSGGLEVASPRILSLINKGVSVEQVAQTAHHFSQAGILVHAYLMYGFPTENAQETVDSLEVVRQLFEIGAVQSAYWHRFAMTVHSPVGQNPEKFGVKSKINQRFPFANNDIPHIDPKSGEHEKYGAGLKKSLYNFMHGIGFDFDLGDWFDFSIPETKIHPNFIKDAVRDIKNDEIKENARLLWKGKKPNLSLITKTKKGKERLSAELVFRNRTHDVKVITEPDIGEFLLEFIPKTMIDSGNAITFSDFRREFEMDCESSFDYFLIDKSFDVLRKNGLLFL